MKLAEALRIAGQATDRVGPPYVLHLACGIMPLHLKTYVHAFLQLRYRDRGIDVQTGVFGDLAGNIERAGSASALAVVVEWADIDARLGLRSLGGWDPATLDNIASEIPARLARLTACIAAAAQRIPVGVVLPTLPLPPVAFTPTWLASAFELRLKAAVSQFAADLCTIPSVRVANSQHLSAQSAMASRLDVRSEVLYGFPYQLAHAEAVASQLVSLIAPPAPKKGLITDLDDTLWLGILGEVGVEGISWDLDHKSQIHGIYQQFLLSLARAGVLIAVASKNDPALVEAAFGRADLLLTKDSVYPVEASWAAKSGGIARILSRWNISPDSVVFVDDSPMEVAEVKAAFPDIECLTFPKQDPQELYGMLIRLRDLFGKESLKDEDTLRLASIRSAEQLTQAASGSPESANEFLAAAGAKITFSSAKDAAAPRILELVNKTNQFNLNGVRHTEAEWTSRLADPDSFVIGVSYEDKYGRLGVISAVSGYVRGSTLYIDVWVMSCRAFSRRIEHACMRRLFEMHGAGQIIMAYKETARNGPVREFLTALLGAEPDGPCTVTKAEFHAMAPPLFHTIAETAHG